MKKLHKFFALATLMAMLTNTGYSQEYYDGGEYTGDEAVAYEEGSDSSYWAAAIPIGALVIAGIIIASTDRHHGGHHHHSSSSSHFHSHSSSSSSSSF